MLSRFKLNLLAKSQVSRDSLRLLLLVRMYETHFHHTEIWMWETRNCCLYSRRRQIMRAVLLFVCPMTPIEVECLLLSISYVDRASYCTCTNKGRNVRRTTSKQTTGSLPRYLSPPDCYARGDRCLRREQLHNSSRPPRWQSYGKTLHGCHMTARRLFVGVTGLAGASFAAVNLTEEGEGVQRFFSSVYCVSRIVFDYKLHRLWNSGVPKTDLHLRSAKRFLRLCQQNGGVMIKAGQYVGTMNHVLPKEYTETLAQLQDCAPSLPFSVIQPWLLAQYATDDLASIFAEFEETPVAAASLAQVHFARTNSQHGSRPVAVKVQYPGLARQVRGDLWTMKFVTAAVGILFPEYQYSWLLPEFEKVAKEELDFLNEACNSIRTKKLFSNEKDVYVPEVYLDISTERVLVMEWIEGARVNDIQTITNWRFSTANIAGTIYKIFGDMIYVHGFIHCDPHPGNLMVRPDPLNHQDYQVVILDHGMYREVSNSFRVAYCTLWKSLITNDLSTGRAAVATMGMSPDTYELLSLILTFRLAGSATKLGERMTKAERQQLRERFRGTSLADVNNFLEGLPRDFLFVLRSTNIIRSLSKDLGGTSKERFLSMANSAGRGLNESPPFWIWLLGFFF